MPHTRRNAFIAAQLVFAAAIVWYAFRALSGQWDEAAARLASLDVGWALVAIATIIVLLTYVLLIDTWRRTLAAWSAALPFGAAARIWFVSNLGKYIPGKIWSIAAMGVMARENAVSPVAAAGSSILIQLVTIASGIGVVLVTGARAIEQPVLAVVVASVVLASIAATPVILPAVVRWAAGMVGREVVVPSLPARIVWEAFFRATLSWVAYGIAFQLFVRAVLGEAAGAVTSYIAVYAASYIIGFLALFAPGGAVVRESAMVAGMLRLGLAVEADALAVAIASRLWLTVVELLPGLAYLAIGRRVSSSTPGR